MLLFDGTYFIHPRVTRVYSTSTAALAPRTPRRPQHSSAQNFPNSDEGVARTESVADGRRRRKQAAPAHLCEDCVSRVLATALVFCPPSGLSGPEGLPLILTYEVLQYQNLQGLRSNPPPLSPLRFRSIRLRYSFSSFQKIHTCQAHTNVHATDGLLAVFGGSTLGFICIVRLGLVTTFVTICSSRPPPTHSDKRIGADLALLHMLYAQPVLHTVLRTRRTTVPHVLATYSIVIVNI